ncbi:MAG: DEAD/DEAH box helicase, partial [Patescibacteria group bacterium]
KNIDSSKLEDPIPKEILSKYNLPSLRTALIWIHAPKKQIDADAARKRFAFEEVLYVQLDRAKERFLSNREKSFVINISDKEISSFINTFNFPFTRAQNNALDTILNDLKKGSPMSRLLEGDVGSGKTAVAATASFVAASTHPPGRQSSSLQVAYMAPTEILAGQHFESFIEYFAKYKVNIGLITGSGARKFPSKINKEKSTKISKTQLLKWVANGEIPILIGTHSLIQKTVRFKNLALIIIDEQHRFGVKQRMQLRRKHDLTPHLLSMTATPIPRTLALTIFGDLDLSLLDELPPGRKPVNTRIVLPQEREIVYKELEQILLSGRQAYVICPRVNDPDPDKENTLNAKSVKSEVERLKTKIFKEFKIEGITGKDKPKDKQEKMQRFKNGEIQILVATSVIEVGVNVPNATAILIENAERFGLAQLHQLRGRVLRSSHQAHCFVFTETKSKKTIDRLKSFVSAKNGFELAEADLKERGSGGLSINSRQWGVSDLAMEALRNIKMVEAARLEATLLIQQDFELKKHPELARRVLQRTAVHME